jgi:hypothetical protein
VRHADADGGDVVSSRVRRVQRRARDGAVLLSAVLCVPACVLWERSYQRVDVLSVDRHDAATYHLAAARGFVFFVAEGGGAGEAWSVSYSTEAPYKPGASVLDHPAVNYFVFRSGDDGGSGWFPFHYWGVALWALVLLLAAWPAARVRAAVVRSRRRRSGSCTACGYDLRATPGRCPECGAAGPPVAEARAA